MKIFLLSLTLASITLASSLAPLENSLVVYNDGLCLVNEKTTLKLNKGDTEITYKRVAKSINPDSVHLNLPKSVTLYSQQYRYDKLTLYKLLDAHIDKKVYIDAKKVTLLSHSGNFSLIQKANGDIIQVKNQEISFKKAPSSLRTQAALIWNVSTDKSIDAEVGLDYLVNNISWESNYVLYIDKDRANLNGFITINNRSGKDYKNTKLFVLAGELDRAKQVRPQMRHVNLMTMAQTPQVKETSQSGYHLYTIPFRVTLANNEKTSIKFIDIKNIKIKRTYIAYLDDPQMQKANSQHSVTQRLEIKSLQKPLAKGVLRTYSKFQDTTILLGESQLKHTPKNTKIDLKLGVDFDTKVKSTLQESSKSKYINMAQMNYLITNDSNENKSIKLHIPFSNINDSEIQSSQKFSFINANLVEFLIKVKANSSYEFNAKFIQKR